jgi:hypothetical protein
MPAVDKIVALLEQLTREDVAALAPAARERFAAVCEHWAGVARERPDPAKAGVLASLRDGQRQE